MATVARRPCGLVLAWLLAMGVAAGCPGPEPQVAAGGAGGTGGAGGASGGYGGSGGSGGGGAGCPCPAVDLLFVVDNTHSISNYATQVLTLAALASELYTELANACSYHVGVVTSKPQIKNPPACQLLGALSQVNSTGQPCGMQNGRYITEADADSEAEFAQMFLCSLAVGQSQSDLAETPMAALFSALAEPINEPEGCNAGFHRPDVPLITVLISDVDDVTSAGEPAAWFDNLRAIKGGDEDLLATVAMFPPIPTNPPDPPPGCPFDVSYDYSTSRLRAFVGAYRVDWYAILNLCQPDSGDAQAALRRMIAAVCPLASR